jgi:hypothetical protein
VEDALSSPMKVVVAAMEDQGGCGGDDAAKMTRERSSRYTVQIFY